MRVVALDREHLAAWTALFDASGSPCFCRYWHFEGTKNDWLARCAFDREKNRDEQSALVGAGAPDARGLVALADGASPTDAALGWMKLAPRATLPKLRRLPVYRALDLGPDDGVWSIGCFLVHPSHRRRGVARALVAAADAHVLAWGGRAIEAYPRRAVEPIHAEEAWQGAASTFLSLGFTIVHGDGPDTLGGAEPPRANGTWPYPVLRKLLAG